VICSHHFKSQDFDDSDILKQKLLGDKYKSKAPRLKSTMVPTIFIINNDKSSYGNTTTKKSSFERIKNQEKKDMVESLIAKKSKNIYLIGDQRSACDENIVICILHAV